MAKTDLLTLLEREHRDLEGRLKMIISTGEACQCVDAHALRKLVNYMRVHMQEEEALLYPRARDEHEVSSLIPEFFDEHDRMKALLDSLMIGRQVTPDVRQMLDACRELLPLMERHVHEEEGRLFPVLRSQWEEEVLLELGDRMLEMKDRALTGT